MDFPFSKSLLNELPLGIVFHGIDGSIVKANPAAESILGLSVAQMQGVTSMDPLWRVVHEDGSPFPGDTHPAMVALKSQEAIHDVLMGVFNPHCGDFVWISVSAFPIKDSNDGTLQGVYALFEDITTLRSAQQQRQEIELSFKSSFDAMSEGMALHRIVYDDQGRAKNYLIVDVNPAYEMHTGISRALVVGKLASDVYGTEEAPFLEIYTKVALTQESVSFEQYFPPLGKHFLINVFSQGKGQFGTIFEDVTQRKLDEEKLKNSELLYRTVVSSLIEGVVLQRLDGGIVAWNSAAEHILGLTADELSGLKAFDLDWETIHRDETPFPLENHPGSEVLRTGMTQLDVTMGIKKPSGIITWVRVNAVPIFETASDKPTSVVVTFEDITSRLLAEESLLINASVFDISQEAIIITDANNLIVDVNPAFTKITGFTRCEVMGKNPNVISSGQQDKGFYKSMWDSLKQNKAWRGEIWNRRKSGEVYPEMLSISAVCDENGKAVRHVAVFSDITNIKEHEFELMRAAHFDALTGLPNRVLLADRMSQSIAQVSRENNMMAVCYLDLDGFKPINDTMGHAVGDEVLIEVARRIEHTIRGGDTVARMGGDEFVVLLRLTQGEECVATLERLLDAISRPISTRNLSCNVSASIGVSIYPTHADDPDSLLRHADQAMYEAKLNGKNRYHIWGA